MGDLYSEQKVAGAIFDLPHHQESHFSFPTGRTELDYKNYRTVVALHRVFFILRITVKVSVPSGHHQAKATSEELEVPLMRVG